MLEANKIGLYPTASQRQPLDQLVELKAAGETKSLRKADSQALQQSVMHLDAALGHTANIHAAYLSRFF